MSMRQALRQAVLLVFLSVGAPSAGANLVTFVISGTVDFTPLGAFQVGDPITQTYTIDTSVSGTGTSTFAFFGNVTAASMVVGAWLASSSHGAVTVQGDNPGFDSYLMDSGTVVPASIGNLDLRYFQFEMFDTSGAMVDDALVPLTHLDALGDNALWLVFGNADTQVGVHGVATSIAVAPEPSTAALVGLAITGLVWRLGARRRRDARP